MKSFTSKLSSKTKKFIVISTLYIVAAECLTAVILTSPINIKLTPSDMQSPAMVQSSAHDAVFTEQNASVNTIGQRV